MIDTLSRDLFVCRTSNTNTIHVQTRSHKCIVTTFLGHFEEQSGTSASWPRIKEKENNKLNEEISTVKNNLIKLEDYSR